MKRYFLYLILSVLLVQIIKAQETVYPAKAHIGQFYLTHAVIHVGKGQVINDGVLKITNNKIESIGTNVTPDAGAKVLDLKGKHVYPGIISPITNLGLKEVTNGVRSTNDFNEMHSLPATIDDDIDQPFKTPSILQKAGVLFSISDNNETTRGGNLMFNAGTAAANGLTKEEALSAVTLNAAKILGIADVTGSLEVGKDANIVVSEGDILDMKNSIITNAFIQGRSIDLTDKHKQLYERYKFKYGL
jgi:imidazolonepropionase-like amidohydrolase